MGVLSQNRNQSLFEFTQGIDVDRRLYAQELRVQAAWARGLNALGLLTGEELKQALDCFEEASKLIEVGKFEWRVQDEDIHMNLERFVTERHGALGKKIHLGRSRNDLIATTLRLFVSDSLSEVSTLLKDVGMALAEAATKAEKILVPGMTHLQNGQPVRLGHAISAHGWALSRDLRRIQNAKIQALEVMPLGSAALAGTTLKIDLKSVAKDLGFGSEPQNSYDSVGDRDFMLEAIQALALSATHLSRLSEDFIIWASSPFKLIGLPKDWSTGSSIMPNKRNPDVPELVRAKSSHLLGAAANALSLLKGLPTSYASDLHELKTVYLRALDEFTSCSLILPPFIRGLEYNSAQALKLLGSGHILATEVADHLALDSQIPFREAYAQVAALVERAESLKVQIHELPEAELLRVAPGLKPSFLEGLSAETAVERRSNSGGTSLFQTREGIKSLLTALRNF